LADPQTSNYGLFVPVTGNDVGTWGSVALNPNFVTIDALFGGVQTLSLSSVPVTLTAPAGFTATPSPGPTQAQNAVLRLTGAITAPVTITLPLPGYYIVENLTTGNFVVTLQAVTATQVIGIDQGMCQHVYNDGANVRFVNLGETGKMEFWTGYSAMPAWVTACTKPPYLLCDGETFTFATYPYLGARYGSNFGGNGATTAATPDMRGRVPLAYDGTGTRITVAGCGINGQTIGASQDKQINTLLTGNLPPYTPAGSVTVTPSGPITSSGGVNSTNVPGGVDFIVASAAASFSGSFAGTPQGGTSTPVNNVQPAQVVGIWVVRAA
jgi:microcystin-dependent protein